MENLINGVLEYSRIGLEIEKEIVDVKNFRTISRPIVPDTFEISIGTNFPV
jgi:hypothetical protein